ALDPAAAVHVDQPRLRPAIAMAKHPKSRSPDGRVDPVDRIRVDVGRGWHAHLAPDGLGELAQVPRTRAGRRPGPFLVPDLDERQQSGVDHARLLEALERGPIPQDSNPSPRDGPAFRSTAPFAHVRPGPRFLHCNMRQWRAVLPNARADGLRRRAESSNPGPTAPVRPGPACGWRRCHAIRRPSRKPRPDPRITRAGPPAI